MFCFGPAAVGARDLERDRRRHGAHRRGIRREDIFCCAHTIHPARASTEDHRSIARPSATRRRDRQFGNIRDVARARRATDVPAVSRNTLGSILKTHTFTPTAEPSPFPPFPNVRARYSRRQKISRRAGVPPAHPPNPPLSRSLLELAVQGVLAEVRVVLHELQALGGVAAVLRVKADASRTSVARVGGGLGGFTALSLKEPKPRR